MDSAERHEQIAVMRFSRDIYDVLYEARDQEADQIADWLLAQGADPAIVAGVRTRRYRQDQPDPRAVLDAQINALGADPGCGSETAPSGSK